MGTHYKDWMAKQVTPSTFGFLSSYEIEIHYLTGEDRRTDFTITKSAKPGSGSLYLECACNEMFGNSPWKVGPAPPDESREYNIKTAHLAIFNRDCWDLLWDFTGK